ncbi:Porin [Paraburkholderia unamae]|uniref:porin n=1 Tax=Paraburkholderia unamae TaxID=219649 RepID=UPI001CB212EA|nr:porin [Paraburkholderia unamae]CAG9251791.1 Porin [Paraburkholderia unamae]
MYYARITTTLILAAALIPCAQAQSSVTLYGMLDAGVAYVSDTQSGAASGHVFKFSSGTLNGPRWGIRGKEDLGGGLAAVFVLENGFNIGTGAAGQGSRLFGRQSYVGLEDNRWGSVTLGRQYDPVVRLVEPLGEAPVFGFSFATPGDVDNGVNTARVNNSIEFVSNEIAGFKAALLYGFGGTPGSAGSGQTWSAAASYHTGSLSAALGYLHADNGATSTNGVRTSSGSFDSLFNTAINSGFASASSTSIARAAVRYAFTKVDVGAGYSRVSYQHDALSQFDGVEKLQTANVYANYALTRTVKVGLGYNYTWSDGVAAAHYNQVSSGVLYSLSAQTELYAIAAWQRANGTTLSSSGKRVAARASLGSYQTDSSGENQVYAAVGVRHRF